MKLSTPLNGLFTLVLSILAIVQLSDSFSPTTTFVSSRKVSSSSWQTAAPATTTATKTTTQLSGFLGDKERDGLTRDSEPEEYFQTNTDKMTDAEKLPIAVAGVAFITLPFIAGLIALYAAK